MSGEFDHVVTALYDIRAAIETASDLSIAERSALDLALRGLVERNATLLSLAETGRARKRGGG